MRGLGQVEIEMHWIFGVVQSHGGEVIEDGEDGGAVVAVTKVLVLFHADHCAAEFEHESFMRTAGERLFPEIMGFFELWVCQLLLCLG